MKTPREQDPQPGSSERKVKSTHSTEGCTDGRKSFWYLEEETEG